MDLRLDLGIFLFDGDFDVKILHTGVIEELSLGLLLAEFIYLLLEVLVSVFETTFWGAIVVIVIISAGDSEFTYWFRFDCPFARAYWVLVALLLG